MNTLLEIYTLSLFVIVVGIGLASLLGFFGRLWWRFELFAHFRVQYAVLAGLSGLGLLIAGQYVGFFLGMVACLLNLAMILPLYQHNKASPHSGHTFRILTANILGSNREYEQISRMLKEAQPDLALLVEYSPHHQDGMKAILQDFPQTHAIPRDDNYGLALLSRLPLLSAEIIFLSEDHKPVLVAKLELNTRPLTIIGTHPSPPKSRQLSRIRNRQMKALAHFAAQQEGEVILLGDLNTTRWSYAFHDLLNESHLRDSSKGFGIQPTWPVKLPLMRIPIDHVLHSPGIQVFHRRTGPFSGSDHRPVMIDFGLQTDANAISIPKN